MLDFERLKALATPTGNVVKIACDGEVIWEKELFINQVPISINPDGTIYNGVGYKNNTRVRSGGAEAANEESVCSGFMPFKIGDTLRIYPTFDGGNVNNAINFADTNFTNLGQITDSGARYGICASGNKTFKTTVVDGVSTLTLTEEHYGSSDIAYIRVTHKNYMTNNGANLVVAVNQEIPENILGGGTE